MRHKRHISHFGRKSGPRKALIRGLVSSLVEHGRIRTTVVKAKELRRHVERAVTLGKKGTLHARRVLLSRYPNESTVTSIINDLAPRFRERPGGYTRIIKVGHRPGDCAEMAMIEFVDHKPAAAAEGDSAQKEAAVDQKKLERKAWKKRKRLNQLQTQARRVSWAAQR